MGLLHPTKVEWTHSERFSTIYWSKLLMINSWWRIPKILSQEVKTPCSQHPPLVLHKLFWHPHAHLISPKSLFLQQMFKTMLISWWHWSGTLLFKWALHLSKLNGPFSCLWYRCLYKQLWPHAGSQASHFLWQAVSLALLARDCFLIGVLSPLYTEMLLFDSSWQQVECPWRSRKKSDWKAGMLKHFPSFPTRMPPVRGREAAAPWHCHLDSTYLITPFQLDVLIKRLSPFN